MYGKWKPSKTARKNFAIKMDEITEFCRENNISQSRDSYYFTIRNVSYRVSNHTIQASNRRAYNEYGEQIRRLYHDNFKDDTVNIFAGKTRIMEIYNNLKAGKNLDGRGNIKEGKNEKRVERIYKRGAM